jgi:hypothetical protein
LNSRLANCSDGTLQDGPIPDEEHVSDPN